MQKIEFGDINKFLVSIGLVLIGLSLLTPYFYLKEDFGILIDSEQILKYDKDIQSILANKKCQVITIQKILPWSSIILFLGGCIISGIGINRWLKRQTKIDEKFDKEIKLLDIKIETSTPEEKVENAKKEVTEIELAEELESNSNKVEISQTNAYLNYMKIEQSLFSLFEKLNSPNFEIYQEPKIGKRFYIDILLKAKSNKFSDRIIEIKYFRNQLPFSTVQKALYQLSTYISYYKNNTNKRVIPILLLVFKEEKINNEKIERYKERINLFSTDIPELKRLKVEFIPENEIADFDVKILLKK